MHIHNLARRQASLLGRQAKRIHQSIQATRVESEEGSTYIFCLEALEHEGETSAQRVVVPLLHQKIVQVDQVEIGLAGVVGDHR